MNTCYIFGAAEGEPEELLTDKSDLIIAADAGYNILQKLNLTPDIILGDFDSLGFIPQGKEIITHPERKDDTDTLLAIKVGFKKGYTRFMIYGGTGKRLDHTVANLQTLSYVAEKGGIAYLCGNYYTATVIKNTSISFNSKAVGNISVFAVSSSCEGVTLKGLSYELENATLTSSFPLGVSNEFIAKESSITVKDGLLLIIWQGNTKNLQKNQKI